jgi:hypothetical protein
MSPLRSESTIMCMLRLENVLRRIINAFLSIFVAVHGVLSRFSRRFSGKVSVIRGRPPSPPRVLGVVSSSPSKSLSTQEVQALSRLLAWAKHNGFVLCTLYSPHNSFSTSTVKKSLTWAGSEFDDIVVWDGWDAPDAWIERMDRMGVAVLGPTDGEAPLAAISLASQGTRQFSQTSPTSQLSRSRLSTAADAPHSLSSLELALRAPQELKNAIGRAAGPVATMDPDMIMIFGGVPSLVGYPSWTTRSSEIYEMGKLGSVTNAKLSAALKRYSTSFVRKGK